MTDLAQIPLAEDTEPAPPSEYTLVDLILDLEKTLASITNPRTRLTKTEGLRLIELALNHQKHQAEMAQRALETDLAYRTVHYPPTTEDDPSVDHEPVTED